MKQVRKILIAVNGRMGVLHDGLRLAQDEQTWVTVVKVLPAYEGDVCLTGIKDIEDVLTGGERSAYCSIDGEARSERSLVKTRIEHGEPSERIIEAASEERCDLIVMGAAEKPGIIRKLFGGDRTVEKVIRNAPCPVLVLGAAAA